MLPEQGGTLSRQFGRNNPEGERVSTIGRSRWGAGVLLAALICAVLAGSGFDSTASAQSPDIDSDDDGLIEVASDAQMGAIRNTTAS